MHFFDQKAIPTKKEVLFRKTDFKFNPKKT